MVGFVFLNAKNSVQCSLLPELFSDVHEVIWVSLRPCRLPRGFSNIIVAVVYHPDQNPDTSNAQLREYLMSTLETIEVKYPNSAIVVADDFNKFNNKAQARNYQLKPLAKIPTRGNNTLDQLFTNLQDYHQEPTAFPPFGLSDHVTVITMPGLRLESKSQRKSLKTRDKRPRSVAALGRFLVAVPWEQALDHHSSCDDKLSNITDIINYGLNTIMPERSVKIHQTDRPWLNPDLKRLISKRQKAFASGNKPLFNLLRNKVNRERKRCRKVYYNNKVRDLKDTRPRDWWREVKQMCGNARSSRPDLRSNLRTNTSCTNQELANKVNEAFLNVMEDYTPLAEDIFVPCDDDEPISVSVDQVAAKLKLISASRAGGPNNLPNWVLKTYSDILARL